MKFFKNTSLACVAALILLPMLLIAQDAKPKTSLEFENAAKANELIRNYTAALQEGDVDKMNAQLHEKAMIYGLGGGLDSLNVEQHKAYFTNSTNQYKHSISGDLYLPVKVEDNWNEGEWLLSWGTNTVTDKKTGKTIEIPYHSVSMIEGDKIVWMRYFYDMLNIMESQGFTLTPPKQ
ncbi:SnoaL-like domain-containing protein [Formosa sp. Hel1_31_208]|uniref:nuclear transport factor 2 family protein n=1 Tax=Formosa sp. Hel1_31_208 TaxID=1798225 RepID=UPI00087CA86F|nr:nuclear transport factor 2 family protein [Formosa sp. Hel1_31_208]SDS29436.1 SnoaL-like domain-containing protein [Formosa sp. Hel1_31_208]